MTPSHDLLELCRCPVCRGARVYPLDWRRVGPTTWELVLRCPDCETQRPATADRDAVHRFNIALYDAQELLVRQSELLAGRRRAGIQERVAAFVSALADDAIVPADF